MGEITATHAHRAAANVKKSEFGFSCVSVVFCSTAVQNLKLFCSFLSCKMKKSCKSTDVRERVLAFLKQRGADLPKNQ